MSGCHFCENAGGEVLWEDDYCRAVWAYEPDYPALCRVIWDRHVKEMTDLEAGRARAPDAGRVRDRAGVDHRRCSRTRSTWRALAIRCRTCTGTSSRASGTTRTFPIRSGGRKVRASGRPLPPDFAVRMRRALDELLKPRGRRRAAEGRRIRPPRPPRRDCCGRAAPRRAQREHRAERAAAPELALDLQARLVARQHVLDDGQPQPGAAGAARAAAVDPVEAFGEPRDVLRLDADAGVAHGERRLAVRASPSDLDLAALRRVAHGVADQVAEARCAVPRVLPIRPTRQSTRSAMRCRPADSA